MIQNNYGIKVMSEIEEINKSKVREFLKNKKGNYNQHKSTSLRFSRGFLPSFIKVTTLLT